MRKLISTTLVLSLFLLTTNAQNSMLEGYIFEADNKGYLDKVAIKIFNKNNKQLVVNTLTNQNGFFSAQVPVGVYYEIVTEKNGFVPQNTILFVKPSDKNKKVFTKIKMFRRSLPASQEVLVARSGTNLTEGVNEYGVTLAQIINNSDPYAEVTNATRLADANYDKGAIREAMKRKPMLTAYKPDVKIDETVIKRNTIDNSSIPSSYNGGTHSRKITTSKPRLGETEVASAHNRLSAQRIPIFYTGYKIEFLTALSELPTSHEIYNRHGHIALEQQPNGIYSYMLGDFHNRQIAENFLKEHLIEKYPMANIVFYDHGKRGRKVGQKKATTKPASAPPR